MQEFTYKIIDNDTFSIIGYNGDEKEVTIVGEGNRCVSVIFDRVFRGHSEIEKINLPDTITDIGAFAFDGLDKLYTIELPEGLENMWQYAFSKSGIVELTIPATVRSIVPFTFENCTALKKVTLKKGTRKIWGNAFKGCIKLEEIVMDKDTQIAPNAFDENQNVKITYTED